MASIGGEGLRKQFGSRLNIAEALILGLISSSDQEYVYENVDRIILEAARIRLEAAGMLNPEHITIADHATAKS